MKSFIEYLAESEQHQYRPRVGDTVGFEINEELLIEARVIGELEEGVEIELDQYATSILESLELANLEEAETDDEDYKRGGSDAWYHRKRKEGQSDKYYAGYDDMAAQEGPSGGKEYGTAKPRRKSIDEAEYQGRKVQLGKPMKGDVKKFKVFVKNPKTGNVKKVNFGDPNMEIKRDDPKRRKNFRARHGCGTSKASDRTKARYWSCRMWSKTPVHKIVKEHTDSE